MLREERARRAGTIDEVIHEWVNMCGEIARLEARVETLKKAACARVQEMGKALAPDDVECGEAVTQWWSGGLLNVKCTRILLDRTPEFCASWRVEPQFAAVEPPPAPGRHDDGSL